MEKFVGPDEGTFAARRVVAPYTLRAATWGGPYGIRKTDVMYCRGGLWPLAGR